MLESHYVEELGSVGLNIRPWHFGHAGFKT